MACNMPNVNVTYTIVNCRHSRDFTNVKAPAPTAQDAQSHRPQAQTRPTTGDARGAASIASGTGAGEVRAKRCPIGHARPRSCPARRRKTDLLAAHHGRAGLGLRAVAMGVAGLAVLGLLHLYTNFQKMVASQGVRSHNKKGMCQKVKPCS